MVFVRVGFSHFRTWNLPYMLWNLEPRTLVVLSMIGKPMIIGEIFWSPFLASFLYLFLVLLILRRHVTCGNSTSNVKSDINIRMEEEGCKK